MHSGISPVPAAFAADDDVLRVDTVPRGTTVDAVFRAHARARPHAIALSYGERQVTYRELDEMSERLAVRLSELGAGAGTRVALLANRGIETIVGMLATLKAGAAYVPFDPSYTHDRLAFMADDCAPAVILAETSEMAEAIGQDGKHVVRVLSHLIDGDNVVRGPRPTADRGEEPAYVMYTSGTTGRPKGVIIPHRAILHLVRDQRFFTFSADEVFLHVTTLSFDPSTLEIWGALLNGAQVAIVPQRGHLSLDEITAAIQRHKPTSTCLTPGILHLLIDHKLSDLAPFKQMMSGGEILSPSHVRKALDALPHVRVVNAYGPTETTTLITYYSAQSGVSWGEGPVPIGEALSHTVIEVLDDKLNPVADGEVGQLCAGGEGLAIGYLNRPELTAEKFIVRNGVRLYLTGDLVRRRPDGLLDFIGRSDTQVKIDGKRVELGEIESCMREDPRVADAVVVVDTTGRGKRLIAYFTWSAAEAARNADDVLTVLRTKLPSHMIPSQALALAEIPLTANLKVDRARLPKPRVSTTAAIAEPASDVERKLRDIWRGVLGFEEIGVEDNFFDLGGTSLQLMEVHERVQQDFGRELEIVAMFENPKIADLARMLRGQTIESPRLAAVQARAKMQGDALKRMRAARAKPVS